VFDEAFENAESLWRYSRHLHRIVYICRLYWSTAITSF
jgi:hypothetical protein